MAFIMDIKNLPKNKRRQFKKFYADYFRYECVRSNPKNPHLCRIEQFLMANRYVEVMMKSIESGQTIGYVAYDFDFDTARDRVAQVPCGFIIGYNTGTGCTNISHLHAKTTTNCYQRLTILKELFDIYSKRAKAAGETQVSTTSDLYDPRLTIDLENLKFSKSGENGTELSYYKKI